MNNEELKLRIGANISRLRKGCGLTQAELAEKLNYSDKAVSKWERGESMPDVLTLMVLAEQFGTDVNEILSDPEGKQEVKKTAAPIKKAAQLMEQTAKVADKGVIQKLSSLLVWIVALFIYLVTDAFGVKNSWMVFVFAVIANAIVLLSLRSAWRLYGWNRILISVIMWGALVFFYLVLWLCWSVSVWQIFLIGLLGQAAIVLWFRMFRTESGENHD